MKKAGCSKIEAALRPLRFDGTDVMSKDSRQRRILNELFTMEVGESDGEQGNPAKPGRMRWVKQLPMFRTLSLERGKTVGQSEFDQVRGRMNAKLSCDICLVKFHRLDRNFELLRNLFCCPALG